MKDIIFKPINNKKVSVAIYEQIIEMIINGTLKPGDKLPSERAMMNMFQRSRPPIREALRMLESTGVIEITPGGGAVVSVPDTTLLQKPFESLITLRSISVRDLVEYRNITEIATAAWAAEHRSESDLKAMMRCITAAESVLHRNPEFFFEQDVNFHRAIAIASGNRIAPIFSKLLCHLIKDVLLKAFMKKNDFEKKHMCEEIVCVHRMIYTAIYDQNVKQTKKIMELHLDSFNLAGNRFSDEA
jgi:GntR family transcriptional repressor for pyruvate dehydrogenase complex